MIERELTDEELLYASEEDWAFYHRIIEGLPSMAGKNNDGLDKFGEYIPYHSGPHILRHFRDTLEIVQPKRIFEIGFNMGHSAAMWLELSSASVVSCDISYKDETIDGAHMLRSKYSERFKYFNRKELEFREAGISLCWLDGGHEEDDVTKDIEWCNELKIPYILADDWYPRFGPGVEPSFKKFPRYEMIMDMNNLKLFLNKEYLYGEKV